MPRCALPEHIDEPHEWDGKDDDQFWFTRWRKRVKHLFAFSHRCKPGIALSPFPPFILTRQWRNAPVELLLLKGKGEARYEAEDDGPVYLSRQQLWCRWHIQIQWPLFFAFHWYWKSKNVLPFLTKEDRDGKIVFFYVGAKRDADGIFWWPAIFFGRNWK
jgi:hypothetical protein